MVDSLPSGFHFHLRALVYPNAMTATMPSIKLLRVVLEELVDRRGGFLELELIAIDLAGARQSPPIDLRRGIPEARTANRLAAMHIGLAHLDHDDRARRLALDQEAGDEIGVEGDARDAVDPQRVLKARDHEQEADPGICH